MHAIGWYIHTYLEALIIHFGDLVYMQLDGTYIDIWTVLTYIIGWHMRD
jgi:hypothetical protein